jgi:hypothetical protein
MSSMEREATAEGSRSQLFFPLVWVACTVVLLVSFQSIGVPRALGDRVEAAVASDYPLAGADPSAEPLPSVLYSGVMWSLVETRITPTDELLGHAVIDVDLLVRNTLVTTPLRVSDRMLSIVDISGAEVTGGGFTHDRSRVTLVPGEVKAVTVSFSTGHDKDPDPANLSLVIAEPNRVAAVLPLGGHGPDNEPPVYMAVESTATILEDPDDPQRQIVVEPQAATLDVNAGPYRAAMGEELAVAKVVVQRSSALDSSSYLQTSYWALDADGTPVAPLVVTRTSQPASNADEVTLLFAFPAEAEDLVLVAGAGGPDAATFALVTPVG